MPNALVIRFSSWGDIVLAQPVLEALAQAGCAVDLWVKPQYGRLAGLLPGAGRVISSAADLAPGYDLVLDLHATGRSRWAGRAARGRQRSTYSKHALARRLLVRWQGRPRFWNSWSPLRGRQSVTAWYAQAVRAWGIKVQNLTPRFSIPAAAREQADQLLARHKLRDRKLAVLAPGATWPTKQWPPEYFSRLAARLEQAWGLAPVVIGGPEEFSLCRQVAQAAGGSAVSLANETELDVLAALLAKTEIVVTNDSGPLHAAVAANCRVLAFFGPTVQEFGFMPAADNARARVLEQNLACRPCALHGSPRCPLGHHACLRAISPDAALAAARELLA